MVHTIVHHSCSSLTFHGHFNQTVCTRVNNFSRFLPLNQGVAINTKVGISMKAVFEFKKNLANTFFNEDFLLTQNLPVNDFLTGFQRIDFFKLLKAEDSTRHE